MRQAHLDSELSDRLLVRRTYSLVLDSKAVFATSFGSEIVAVSAAFRHISKIGLYLPPRDRYLKLAQIFLFALMRVCPF